jgi:hypothetical protein
MQKVYSPPNSPAKYPTRSPLLPTDIATEPEHRLFSFITKNWRGQPLVSHEVIVNLIAATTTRTGLRVQSQLDTATYPKGIKVSKPAFAAIHLRPDTFHGEWNYTITPSS